MTSTATRFELCLQTRTRKPILVKNMNSHDTVRNLKLRISDQEGISLAVQRVFLADRELKDGMSANIMV